MAYALDQLGQYLRDLRKHSTLVRTETRPAPGSLAEREADGLTPEQQAFVREGVLLANARLLVAEEHLATLGLLIRDPETIYTVYTVARTAAEVSAHAWWLLDPTISGPVRAGRSLGQRIYSLEEQALLPMDGAKDQARQRRKEVAKRGAAAGITRVRAPGPTKLMAAVYGDGPTIGDSKLGELVYRLHSAFTHGTAYAIHHLMQPATDVDGQPIRIDGDTVAMHVYTDADTEVLAVMAALSPYAAAANAFMSYTGRESADWRSYLVYVMGEVRRFLPYR